MMDAISFSSIENVEDESHFRLLCVFYSLFLPQQTRKINDVALTLTIFYVPLLKQTTCYSLYIFVLQISVSISMYIEIDSL